MLWTVHVENGPRKVNHAAACVGERVYSFGGYCASEPFGDWTPIPIHILNTANYRWSFLHYEDTNYVPFQRYGHTVVVYQEKVYLWGGRNNHVAFKTLCCFDPVSNDWTVVEVVGRQPYPKDGHSACVINDVLYIFGGFENISTEYSKDIFAFSFKTRKWTEICTKGTPPSPRDFHTAVAVGTRMYVYGGRSPDNVENEFYCFKMYYLDTLTNEWHHPEVTGDIPVPRRSHSAWLYGNDIYVFGGYNSKINVHFNDLHKFNVETNEWTRLNVPGHVPCIRRRQCCVLVNDKVHLFGGTRPDEDSTPDNDETLVDMSDLHVLDYRPTLKTLCILAILKYNLNQECLPEVIKCDILAMTKPNQISLPIYQPKYQDE